MSDGMLGRVDVEGLSVAYRRAGAGEPVVLLHGWPTSNHVWRHSLHALADAGRRAIAPDLPGFGASDKPPAAPYTLDRQARMLEKFLAAIGVENAALVMHDLGGPIGLLWAVRHPGRLERLVMLDTIVFPRNLPPLRALLAGMRVPGLGSLAVRPAGLLLIFSLGLARGHRLDAGSLDAYREPFACGDARARFCARLSHRASKSLRRLRRGSPRCQQRRRSSPGPIVT